MQISSNGDFFEFLAEKLCLRARLYRWSLLDLTFSRRLTTEDGQGEFSIVQAATAILIIDLEERLELRFRVLHSAFLESTAKLVEVHSAGVHHIEVLEHLHETGLLRHLCVRFLNQLVLQSLLEPSHTNILDSVRRHQDMGKISCG